MCLKIVFLTEDLNAAGDISQQFFLKVVQVLVFCCCMEQRTDNSSPIVHTFSLFLSWKLSSVRLSSVYLYVILTSLDAKCIYIGILTLMKVIRCRYLGKTLGRF